MSVMNRRNALLGWATWTVFKQVLRRSSRARAAEAEGETRRLPRFARSDPPAETKKRSKGRLVAFVAAAAVGVGVWLRSRGREENGEFE
jgi:hypothetical protein